MASPATKLRFLTATQVTKLYNRFIYRQDPTQPNLLESAVNSPMNIRHYEQEGNVFRLAASLSEKIMKNHAFADGNKRTALIAADMFLKINGYQLQEVPFSDDKNNLSIAAAHVAVTTGAWDVDTLSRFYEGICTPITSLTPEILAYRSEAVEY